MHIYENRDPSSLKRRSHPWTTGADPAHRYVDFRIQPELIRVALEDFVAIDGQPAAETFYGLVEWLNGADSPFESNDCALAEVAENQSPRIPTRLVCSGRLMILFRELSRNCSPARVHALTQATARACAGVDRDFERAAIGLSIVEVQFRTLPRSGQQGQQLMIGFWVGGDELPELWRNLDRTFQNLDTALRSPPVRACAD
ncbi:MAG: hypothetical protein EXR71_07410 [Myxococcales bacterium]|nr:hypothetical protein [Myxococcales bacterium]